MLPLYEPFHDAFTWADQRRRQQLPELADNPAYRWHATHTVRALTHNRLNREGRIGAWRPSDNHSQNGALWFTDNRYRLRVLHALNESDVPPPGSNRARRAFYSNPPLIAMPPLFGKPNDRLLVLWRIDPKTGAVDFRVVRPIGEWKWGTHQAVDLDFMLPQTANELSHLSVRTSG